MVECNSSNIRLSNVSLSLTIRVNVQACKPYRFVVLMSPVTQLMTMVKALPKGIRSVA